MPMMKDDSELPDIEALNDEELRELVRLYHRAMLDLVAENNQFSHALEKGVGIWTSRLNGRMAALRAFAIDRRASPTN
jgi:hypothetical protein